MFLLDSVINKIIILIFCVLQLKLLSQIDSINYNKKQDSIYNYKYKKEKTIYQASLYKYYIYSDAWDYVRGFGIHFEINTYHKRSYFDYLHISIGFKHDQDWIDLYPKLQGEYNLNSFISYVLINNKRRINHEVSFGFSTYYGDPVARDSFQSGFNGSKFMLVNNLTIALRYSFDKIPLQLRPSVSTLYSFITKKGLPFFPSFSIGYGFKKIKNEQIKMQTYSNTDY